MKKTLSESDFVDGFEHCGRGNQFSRDARQWLFDYYEECESGCEEEMEYDPIGICCEWTEYDSNEELIEEFKDHLTGDEEDEDEKLETIKDYLGNRTTIGDVGDGIWLVANY